MKYSEYNKSSNCNEITHTCTIGNSSFAKISKFINHTKTHLESELFSQSSMDKPLHKIDHTDEPDGYLQPRPFNEQTDNSLSHIKIETDVINGDTFKSIVNREIDFFPPTEKLNFCSQVKIETDLVDSETHGTDVTDNNNGTTEINNKNWTESLNNDISEPIYKTSIKICNVCGNEFNKSSKLKKHMKAHIKIISRKIYLRNGSTVNTLKKFQCDICNELYSDMSKIRTHMETHTEEKSVSEKKCLLNKSAIDVENKFNCDVCDKYFPTVTSLNEHVQIIHEKKKNTKQNNNINTKLSADSLNLRRKIKFQSKSEPKEYDVGQNSYSVNKQNENNLEDIKIETDIIDGITFKSILAIENNSITNFNTNISTSSLEKNINDKIKIEAVTADNNDNMNCDGDENIKIEKIDDFLSGEHLNSDVISSTNKESMKTCDLCDKSFFKKYLLRKHLKIHMMEGTCLKKKQSVCVNSEKKFKCLVCDKMFTASSSMRIHTRIFHTEKKIYKCNECHKSFSDIVYLRRHRKFHAEKPHQCEVCQKSFPVMSNLKVHMNVHTGIKPWKCDVCERSYADRTSFKKHMQYHNEGYSFKCNICNRSLKRRNSLKNHMMSHCNGNNLANKKYECNICEKSYTSPFVLKRHMAIHTGEKLFTCDICKKSFAAKEHLKRHIIIIHMQENKYKCHTCNKLFSDAYYFKLHKTLHDNKKPYECNFCKKSFSHRTFLTIHIRNHRTRHECKICKTLYSQMKLLKTHMKQHHSD